MRELKIDKDCIVDKDWIQDYLYVVCITCSLFGANVEYVKMCPSKSKGLHFYITVNPDIDATLANKLQFLLGDDARRVDFNRARIASGLEEWNKLFEVEGRKLRTIYRGSSLDEEAVQGNSG